MKIFVILLLVALSGCATTAQRSPEEICAEINPDPAMLSLMSPVEIAPGIKLGSVGAVVRDGRCEVTGAFYVNTQVVGLDRAREIKQQAIDLAAGEARKSLAKYPPGTVRARYQFLPTPPMEPFTVEIEAGK